MYVSNVRNTMCRCIWWLIGPGAEAPQPPSLRYTTQSVNAGSEPAFPVNREEQCAAASAREFQSPSVHPRSEMEPHRTGPPAGLFSIWPSAGQTLRRQYLSSNGAGLFFGFFWRVSRQRCGCTRACLAPLCKHRPALLLCLAPTRACPPISRRGAVQAYLHRLRLRPRA